MAPGLSWQPDRSPNCSTPLVQIWKQGAREVRLNWSFCRAAVAAAGACARAAAAATAAAARRMRCAPPGPCATACVACPSRSPRTAASSYWHNPAGPHALSSKQIYAAPLSCGARAVVLLNRHNDPPAARIAVHWVALGYPADVRATVRDLYARKDLGVFRGSYTAEVEVSA